MTKKKKITHIFIQILHQHLGQQRPIVADRVVQKKLPGPGHQAAAHEEERHPDRSVLAVQAKDILIQ